MSQTYSLTEFLFRAIHPGLCAPREATLLWCCRHSSRGFQDTVCLPTIFGGSGPLPDLISQESAHLISLPPQVWQALSPHEAPSQSISMDRSTENSWAACHLIAGIQVTVPKPPTDPNLAHCVPSWSFAPQVSQTPFSLSKHLNYIFNALTH